MSRKNTRRAGMAPADIPMTPMIDVVFQLLIYFLVTTQAVDIMSNFSVFRPTPVPIVNPKTSFPMVRIMVSPDGFTLNSKPVDARQLNGLLDKLASIDRSQHILINCTAQSKHELLIQVLDSCAKSGFQNLSVVSSS